MINISVHNTITGATSVASVADKYAPALRSALNEIRTEVGGRLAGAHRFPKEYALTRAATALGQLVAAVNSVIPQEDPDYD